MWLQQLASGKPYKQVARLFAASCLFLVAPSALSQQFNLFAYGEGSGLSNLNATTLLQDHNGLIWAGTESGVFTGDGPRFDKQTAFTDADIESVRSIKEDEKGRIWVADGRHLAFSQNGKVQQPIPGMQFHVLSHEALDLAVMPGTHDAIYFLRAGNLSLVSSHDSALSWHVTEAFSPSFLTQHPELKAITSVVSTLRSELWLGCGDALCKFDPRTKAFARFDQQSGVPKDKWQALMVSRSGDVWARGDKDIVVLPSGANAFEVVPNLPAGCFHNIRQAILSEDSSGAILLNLVSGIAIGGRSGWRVLNDKNGLPGDETDSILFDRSGALWLTSVGHGILRWQGHGDWEGWNKSGGLHNNVVWGLTRDAFGGIWIATDAGLDKLDTAAGVITSQGSFTQRLFSVVVDKRQHIWVADPKGQVLDIDPRTKVTRVAVDKLERIFQVRGDSQQRIWVCSRKGLLFFTPEDGWSQPHVVQDSAGPVGYAWSVSEGNDGSIWISTAKGLYRLKNEKWSTIHVPFKGGIEYNRMVAIAPDGTLWMQNKLPYPILHLKIEGDNARVLDQVDAAMMASDNTTFVEMDQRGWLWVGSDDGLRVFNGKQWILCTAEDGLLWNDTDFHAFYADPDGSVWIGTSAGVSHLLHPEHLFAHAPPEVRLADVALSGREIAAGGPSYDLRRPALSFRFLNVNYDRGTGVVAQYRLEGEENDWQDTNGGLIRFPALNAGRYNLHVRAYDKRLHTSSGTIDIPFTVLEPWWKRRCFLVIEGLASILFLLGLWRLSVRLLVARQQELERLVASRTSELEKEKAELMNARSALLEITRHDALTGLLNRSAIFERLDALCEATRQSGTPIAIIMADLDSFKRINDTYGHLVGDTVLRACADRIGDVTRPVDAIGRYGGEELLILMPGLSIESIAPRIEQLRVAIADEPICRGEVSLSVTCSFGVAWFHGGENSVEILIGIADSALYLAKQNGRNRIEYAERATA